MSDTKPTNPFDQGEWVLLHPPSMTCYNPDGTNASGEVTVRRSTITAVKKFRHPRSDKHAVQVVFPGGEAKVMFEGSPEGSRLVDLLVQACIGPPRQRMVELWPLFNNPEKHSRFVRIDDVHTITVDMMRAMVVVDLGSGGFDHYYRDLNDDVDREAFLRLCGAKVE